MIETNENFRKQVFLPEDHNCPPLYSTEDVEASEKLIHLHYFIPQARSMHIFVAELNTETAVGFGYSCLGDELNAEWGYISLIEIEEVFTVHPQAGALIFVRDETFTPQKFAECAKMLET